MAEAGAAREKVDPVGAGHLRVHNTLTRAKESFVPLDPTNIRMYVCGPTVYDFAHIGNARPVIVFDVLFRLLRHLYGEAHVSYARNLTDIDDKINARAFDRWTRQRSLNDEIRALTETTAAQFHADVAELGVLTPALVNAPGAPARMHEPRATEYVCDEQKPLDMVRVIERLIANGNAYVAEGHVLFHVPSMPGYGALARRPRDELLAGARVDVAPYKRDPMDFVLWKPSDPDREPGWESPWGLGRPGWHIECSAMSGALFGEVFDIHAGGIDLIFPHHENEIAQSCCAFGKPGTPNPLMARYWMHNGFLQVEGQKMSKSLGNFITIRQLLSSDDFGGRAWHGDVLRLAMLRTHYRQPIDWTIKGLEETERMLLSWLAESGSGTSGCRDLPGDFVAALADDLNTPAAIAALHKAGLEMRTAALRFLGFTRTDSEIRSHARRCGQSADQTGPTAEDLAVKVEPLIAARLEARRIKDFATSDRLRDELLELGVEIMDAKDKATGELSTTWRMKP